MHVTNKGLVTRILVRRKKKKERREGKKEGKKPSYKSVRRNHQLDKNGTKQNNFPQKRNYEHGQRT